MLSRCLSIIILCFYVLQSTTASSVPAKVPNFLPAGVEPSAGCKECKASMTFASKEAKKYEVGTNIPTLPFKTKPSWAGQIDVPDTPSVQNGSLFFWLWLQDSKVPGGDLVIWMNGGPGCTSELGQTTENGPFLFGDHKNETKPNPYSWTTAADILYITQPVGDAYTSGSSRQINEFQTSDQFALWLKNFFQIFPELSKKRFWITGESYQGVFMPFIFDSVIRSGKTVQGGMLIDPTITDETVQFSVPAYNFAKDHQKLLNFTNEDLAKVKNESDTCHLTNFAQDNLNYPPRGRLPTPDPNCNPFEVYANLADKRVKNFNIYNIAKPYEDFGDEQDPFFVFFNSTEVQKYIHAPTEGFRTCKRVFGKWGDRTAGPPDSLPNRQDSYLAQMIEHSKRFIIANGLLDGLLISMGNKIALQNLTWNGAQGFNKPVHVPLYDVDGKQTAIGTNEERGLTFVEVANAGHMIPADQPAFALAALEFLLGKRDWTKE